MVTLYITSKEAGEGRTTVCVGIGKYFKDNGKKTGFFKPTLEDADNSPGEIADRDSVFMKSFLALDEPLEHICPVLSGWNNLSGKIKEAYNKIAAGKDVVIVEGSYEKGIVEALDARVIIIDGYSDKLSEAELIGTCREYGGNLLGLVLNKVPANKLEQVRDEISAQLAEAGINVLGVLPEDRVLSALTVGELAESLNGEVLCCADKSAELLESFMLGAMTPDSGPEYFGRKTNKAVVVKSERPDMQMAALETSTRCLILSGHTAPIRTVSYLAEDKGVPVILVNDDTTTIVTGIDNALSKTRFNQEKKLPRLIELMQQHFNFKALNKGMGPAS